MTRYSVLWCRCSRRVRPVGPHGRGVAYPGATARAAKLCTFWLRHTGELRVMAGDKDAGAMQDDVQDARLTLPQIVPLLPANSPCYQLASVRCTAQ